MRLNAFCGSFYFSARACIGQHVTQLRASVNEYSSMTIALLGTLASELKHFAFARKGTDDSPSDSGRGAL